MHRTLAEAAAVLGIPTQQLRKRLKAQGVLQSDGLLASKYREGSGLYTATRCRWNPAINNWTHYGVVMVQEEGIQWLAKRLGIAISKQEVQEP